MAPEDKSHKPRLIAPGSVLLKCVDGRWNDTDGLTPTGDLIAVGTFHGLQRFNGKGEPPDEIPETPDKHLTQDDADALNAKIPKEEWRAGLDGDPDPPWKLVHGVYLIHIDSGTRYTFMNSTWGAQVAVERLESRMETVRALRGNGVRPIVQLDSRPWKTSYGQKIRPEFTILEFQDFSGRGGVLLGGGVPLIEHKTETAAEALRTRLQAASAGDQNREGFRAGAVENAINSSTEKTATKTVGKPVKPVSVSEEINDSLPPDLAPPI